MPARVRGTVKTPCRITEIENYARIVPAVRAVFFTLLSQRRRKIESSGETPEQSFEYEK